MKLAMKHHIKLLVWFTDKELSLDDDTDLAINNLMDLVGFRTDRPIKKYCDKINRRFVIEQEQHIWDH